MIEKGDYEGQRSKLQALSGGEFDPIPEGWDGGWLPCKPRFRFLSVLHRVLADSDNFKHYEGQWYYTPCVERTKQWNKRSWQRAVSTAQLYGPDLPEGV